MYLPGRDFKLCIYTYQKGRQAHTLHLSYGCYFYSGNMSVLITYFLSKITKYIITVRKQTVMGGGKDTVCYHDILHGDINPGTLSINILLNKLK